MGRQAVKIAPDTNVLVRAMTGDDPHQSRIARAELAGASSIALAIPALCELVWVLSRSYGIATPEIAGAIRRLIDGATVVVNRAAVEAGLAVLEAGGDFADGIIAFEGRHLGADTFVSFDRRAVTLIGEGGQPARLLS